MYKIDTVCIRHVLYNRPHSCTPYYNIHIYSDGCVGVHSVCGILVMNLFLGNASSSAYYHHYLFVHYRVSFEFVLCNSRPPLIHCVVTNALLVLLMTAYRAYISRVVFIERICSVVLRASFIIAIAHCSAHFRTYSTTTRSFIAALNLFIEQLSMITFAVVVFFCLQRKRTWMHLHQLTDSTSDLSINRPSLS